MVTVIYGSGDIASHANNYTNDYAPIFYHPFTTLHPKSKRANLEALIRTNPYAIIVTNDLDILKYLIVDETIKIRFVKVMDIKFPGTNDHWKVIKHKDLKELYRLRKEFR
jgi:hypothetical protein